MESDPNAAELMVADFILGLVDGGPAAPRIIYNNLPPHCRVTGSGAVRQTEEQCTGLWGGLQWGVRLTYRLALN